MSHIFQRTSTTVDEAVYILLGQIDGPVVFTPVEESGWAEVDSISFNLRETLEDELDVIAGEYALAKAEQQPADVIAKKYSALQQQEAVIAQANAYLCAIHDELNKGEQSTLKVDRELSNSAYTFITLHSFNEWAKGIGKGILIDLPTGIVEPAISSPSHTGNGTKPPPRIKLREQEEAILAEIKRLDFDPMALPKNLPGIRGVKAAVREALQSSTLFEANTAFEKAWERLRKEKRIQDAPPHK